MSIPHKDINLRNYIEGLSDHSVIEDSSSRGFKRKIREERVEKSSSTAQYRR